MKEVCSFAVHGYNQIVDHFENIHTDILVNEQVVGQLNDFDGALKDLQKVRELQPDDKGVLNEIARAKKAKLDLVKKEKQLYSKMFK